ncbi:MAG TPA: hypothetical protein PLN95_02325 [Candidatus Saccharibacteria bacterium]|nr:hypothetical protein [Candidatus Saccharibacteria bacterium]
MTNPRPLSVEVFRDRDFPDASVECAEAGISNVERVIRGYRSCEQIVSSLCHQLIAAM